MSCKKGENLDKLRETNRSLILQILARTNQCTRVMLSEKTGLKQATITKIVNTLIEKGIVRECGNINGRVGRRAIALELNAARYKVISVSLSRQSYALGVFDLLGQGSQVLRESLSMEEPVTDILDRIISSIRSVLACHNDIYAIGMASPCPFLSKRGTIALMTGRQELNDIDLTHTLASQFDIPVYLAHDANAGALAELHWGNHNLTDKHHVLVHLLAKDGIGAGILCDEKLFTGSKGIAGELGHMSINSEGPLCSCGNHGCLECYCSSLAFTKHVTEELRNHPESSLNQLSHLTVDDIFDAMEQGDPFAIAQVKRVGYYFGCGIVNAINLYDPDVLVISGHMIRGGAIMMDEIWATVQKRIMPKLLEGVKICYTTIQND